MAEATKHFEKEPSLAVTNKYLAVDTPEGGEQCAWRLGRILSRRPGLSFLIAPLDGIARVAVVAGAKSGVKQ